MDHLPQPAGKTLHIAQNTVKPLCHRDTSLACVQPGVQQAPQVVFCQMAFQLFAPQHVLVPGVDTSQVQDFTLLLVEPQDIKH